MSDFENKLEMTQQNTSHDSRLGFIKGIQDTISMSIAGGLFGFVFGVLAYTQGLSEFEATFMSAILYSGSAQIVVLGTWVHGHLPIVTLMIMSFIVSLRFVLMGASLQPYFKGLPALPVYLSLFFLIDENWAVTMLKAQREKQLSPAYLAAYCCGSGFIFYVAWIISTYLGHHFAEYIHNPKALGFDFAFTAIFLALLVGIWRDKRDMLPWTIAFIVAALSAKFLSGNWYIITGALAGSLTGAWRESH